MTMNNYTEQHVTDKSKLPTGQHWAILVFEPYSIHHEGDERSRTNPGHGYGAYTESGVKTDYYAFTDHQQWIDCIKYLEEEGRKPPLYNKTTYCALVVLGQAMIRTNVTVEVDNVRS